MSRGNIEYEGRRRGRQKYIVTARVNAYPGRATAGQYILYQAWWTRTVVDAEAAIQDHRGRERSGHPLAVCRDALPVAAGDDILSRNADTLVAEARFRI